MYYLLLSSLHFLFFVTGRFFHKMLHVMHLSMMCANNGEQGCKCVQWFSYRLVVGDYLVESQFKWKYNHNITLYSQLAPLRLENTFFSILLPFSLSKGRVDSAKLFSKLFKWKCDGVSLKFKVCIIP